MWKIRRIDPKEWGSLDEALDLARLRGPIWCMGNEEILNAGLFVSVGGSRSAEGWDLAAMEALSGNVSCSACIVSGGAIGTDCAAHRGALQSGGTTIVVVPVPLEHISLSSWRPAMASLWDPDRTLFLSPFGKTARITRSSPIARNRLIAALADTAVAGRTSIRSGTNHFISVCRAMGIPLFVLNEADDDPGLRTAFNNLKQNGARLFQRDETLSFEFADEVVAAARACRRRKRAAADAQLRLLETVEPYLVGS